MSVKEEEAYRHSEEVNEIITAVPSWILQRGIALILLVLTTIVLISAFVSYPDLIKTSLKVNSLNSPKDVISHQSGKIVRLLINNNDQVNLRQPLAFIESTADHKDVIALRSNLESLNKKIIKLERILPNDLKTQNMNFGELQSSYQIFHQEFIQFLNTQKEGIYAVQKAYLKQDLSDLKKLQRQILDQRAIQEKEFRNVEDEYGAYKKLKDKNVISNSEFKQQENRYLSGKYPLQQSSIALVNNRTNYLAKEKELIALENTVQEKQREFVQALNSMRNETEAWMAKYVILAPISGKLSFNGFLQENQNVSANQTVFVINPGSSDFFGEVKVPQYNLGKVKTGQKVLVKLHSYPFEEYGMIEGKVSYITDFALRDSIFIAKISFQKTNAKDSGHPIILKTGMMGDAEIITEENSLLQRFYRSFIRLTR